MGERVIESVARSNWTASFPQVMHTSETFQSHEELSSNSYSAQCGANKLEHSSQSATRGTKRCNSPSEFSTSRKKILPSCEAALGWDEFDTTKSLPQIDAISPVTDYQVGEAKSDHGKKSVSLLIDSTPEVSPELFEPLERLTVAANPWPVDDEPTYNIGGLEIYDQTQQAIPKLYESRWQVIRPDIFDRVHNRLGRGRFALRLNKRKTPVIIELMSAGVTKTSSMPAVVVVIPRHVKTMQDFLDTDSTVQYRCKPEDGTTVELLALACKGSSTLIGMPSDSLRSELYLPSDSNSEYLSDGNDSPGSADESDSSAGLHSLTTSGVLEVDAQSVSVVHDPNNIDGDLRHGMGIRLVTKDGSRYVRGTCGGLLQLTIPNQPPRQVGLMAGHLFAQLGQDSKEGEHNNTGSSLIIGDMVYPKSSGSLPRNDWALFDATKLGFEQNMTNQSNVTVVQGSEFPDVNTTVIVRTSRGDVTGTLSSSSSGILLNPDHGFVHVRTIMMNKDSILTNGDSGAWVFERGCEKVCGYIIATNGNYHAYMVPFHAAIAEIQMTLGATGVSLAISTDPDGQLHPGTTGEHVGQMERSILLLQEDESIQSVMTIPNDGQQEEMTDAGSSQEQSLQESQSQLDSQDRLAKAYLQNGRVKEAIEILESVVQLRENVLGPGHTSCLASKHELAVAYTEHGQTKEAIRILKHVVETEAVVPDNSNIGRLASQHELARAFLADGQVSEAIKLLEDVVAIKSSSLEQSDPQLLVSQHELARAYLANGQTSEAIKLLKHVVAVKFSSLERSDPHLLVSQHGLAKAYLADGQASEAVQVLEGVVAVKSSIFEQLDSHLLVSQHELAKAYLEDSQASEAIELLEGVVAEKTTEKSNPHLLALQIVLAEAFLRAGRASDAVNVLEHVVALATAASSEHEDIRAISLQWLESARSQLYDSGDLGEAPAVTDSLVAGTSERVYSYSVDTSI